MRRRSRSTIAARKPGRIAGLGAALMAFRLLDPDVRVEIVRPDGSDVVRGDAIATLSGSMRGILSAERTALNLISRLSGIATATAALVAAVSGTQATIACTRKLTPGLRTLEKYAIRVGGGLNHRFGLDDAVLIKDNHIAAVGGIRPALERVRLAVGHLVKVEIEVDTLWKPTARGAGGRRRRRDPARQYVARANERSGRHCCRPRRSRGFGFDHRADDRRGRGERRQRDFIGGGNGWPALRRWTSASTTLGQRYIAAVASFDSSPKRGRSRSASWCEKRTLWRRIERSNPFVRALSCFSSGSSM